MQRPQITTGHVRSDGALLFAPARAPIFVPDSASSDREKPSTTTPTGTPGRFADFFFSSRRQLNLHAYDPHVRPKEYVEVKIGVHPLDHRLPIDAEAQRARPHGPLKMLPRTTSVASNQSLAFEARERPTLIYASVKIGGHALDHVRFFDKGLPSRPLWGFSARVVVYPGVRPQVSAAQPPQHAIPSVPRGLSNLYACGHCQRMRQSPRVQLCCGHALCASCLSSDTTRHAIVPSPPTSPTSSSAAAAASASSPATHMCLLECVQCKDFVAMAAVVFPPDRVLHVDHRSSARTLRQLLHRQDALDHGRADGLFSRLACTSGGALGALVATVAAATGRLRISSPRSRHDRTLDESSTTHHHRDDIAVDELHREEADGAARWLKRVRGLTDASASRLTAYAFVRTLGVGNFAEVMLVRDRRGALCVLKESDKLREAVNEMALLSKVRSAHVVRIHAYFVEEIAHRPFAYIAMEYCDRGDLGERLARDGPLDAAAFDDTFRQLCLGLSEIHAHGIVHRDLKPGNVLLTSEGLAKIADFGVSTCLESNLLTHHAAGTLAFMAPEVRRFFLGENVSYDARADIWSLGVLAVAMLSGDPEPRVATRIADEVIADLVDKFATSERHASLLRGALDQDPRKRPSLDDLLEMVPPMSARL